MAIFISIIIGIIIFYKVIIPFVHNQYYPNTEKRITKGLLSMSFWQILFSALVCTYSLEVEPVYKQTDEDVNSFIQEYSEVGDLINEYTGINATSNFNYLMSEAESLHTYTIIFIIVAIILALATAIGSIGKKLDKRIVEGISIITTLGCCWIAKSSTDLYELIIRDGATLQTIAWIGRLFGTDIYSAMDWIIRIIWLCPLILIIKHFFYHKTLDEYYAVSIPQSEAIKQKEENIIREERTVTEEQPDIESPKQSVPINQMEGSVIIEKQINEKTPEPGPINQQEENSTLPEEEPVIIKEQPQSKIEETDKKPSVPFNLLFGIGLVVLMGVVAWWILQSNEKDNYTPTVENQTENIADKDIYEQRSNEIIRELTSKYGDKIQVEYKYPELSKYCTFGLKGEDDYNFRYLLVYDLDREILKQFDTQSLFTNNHKELFLATYSISINSQNNKLLISGNNGANSIGYTEYLLELDPSNWQIREICSGSEVIKKQDGYIANRRIMTKWGDCVAMSEFVNIDIYYNLNGNLIIPSTSGNNYQLKGLIDNKYSVTMQLSIQNNKIYGKYYYEKNGSDNFLYLYGGISESGDVALLEFNSEGQQTSNFKGRFTNDFFYGTFTNYKNIEMPFELHFENNNLKTTEVTLKRYYNSRFGYSILYPSSFSNLRESDNSDGCRFSKDNHTYLSVSGMYNGLNETIEDKYNEYKAKSPVYSKLKGNWFVVSDYTENGDIYYLKTVLKNDIFMTAILYYPNSEKDFYSKIIPKIFTNFPD